MKKFFTDNIHWMIILIFIISAVAMYFALKNRQKLKMLPDPTTEAGKALTAAAEEAGKTPTSEEA